MTDSKKRDLDYYLAEINEGTKDDVTDFHIMTADTIMELREIAATQKLP